MWLNKDALHVPCSNEGHISAMIDWAPSRSTCRHLHQLGVCKLLQCRGQVVYLIGLNGGLEPVLHSLPKLPVWDMNTLSRPVHKPLLLQVDLSPVMQGDQMHIAQGPCKVSTLPSSPCLATQHPSVTANCTSLATELHELLSQVMLETSSPASGDTTPRKPTSIALSAPLTIGVEDPFGPDRPVLAALKLVATSQQVSP